MDKEFNYHHFANLIFTDHSYKDVAQVFFSELWQVWGFTT